MKGAMLLAALLTLATIAYADGSSVDIQLDNTKANTSAANLSIQTAGRELFHVTNDDVIVIDDATTLMDLVRWILDEAKHLSSAPRGREHLALVVEHARMREEIRTLRAAYGKKCKAVAR